MLIIPTIMAYIQNPTEYSLFWLLFWNICTFVWIRQLATFALMATMIWYLKLLHIRYQFMEINEKIKKCVKNQMNCRSLLDLFAQHSKLTKLVSDMNYLYKYVLFIIYYNSDIRQYIRL